MAFHGSHFSFNGTPCEKFGLAIYDIDSNTQGNTGMIASTGEVVEDWVPSKSKSFFYGVKQNNPLSFNMVFGVDMEQTHFDVFPTMEDYLDRWEIAQISNWLTGHNDGRKWLEIEQFDMESVRFLCTITNLQIITVGWYPWAFSCTVTCDSPYGYMFPKTYRYSCSNTLDVVLNGKHMTNEMYYPKMEITPKGAGDISIINISDNSREFLLKVESIDVEKSITVDNDRQIISINNERNLYDGFNLRFLRLRPGQNKLKLSGNFDINITCEFPVNIGG